MSYPTSKAKQAPKKTVNQRPLSPIKDSYVTNKIKKSPLDASYHDTQFGLWDNNNLSLSSDTDEPHNDIIITKKNKKIVTKAIKLPQPQDAIAGLSERIADVPYFQLPTRTLGASRKPQFPASSAANPKKQQFAINNTVVESSDFINNSNIIASGIEEIVSKINKSPALKRKPKVPRQKHHQPASSYLHDSDSDGAYAAAGRNPARSKGKRSKSRNRGAAGKRSRKNKANASKSSEDEVVNLYTGTQNIVAESSSPTTRTQIDSRAGSKMTKMSDQTPLPLPNSIGGVQIGQIQNNNNNNGVLDEDDKLIETLVAKRATELKVKTDGPFKEYLDQADSIPIRNMEKLSEFVCLKNLAEIRKERPSLTMEELDACRQLARKEQPPGTKIQQLFHTQVNMAGCKSEDVSVDLLGRDLVVMGYRPKGDRNVHARKVTEIVKIPDHVTLKNIKIGRHPNGMVWIEEWSYENGNQLETLHHKLNPYLSPDYRNDADSIATAVVQGSLAGFDEAKII